MRLYLGCFWELEEVTEGVYGLRLISAVAVEEPSFRIAMEPVIGRIHPE